MPVSMEPEYKMDVPYARAYKDIHSGLIDMLPPLKITRLREYLQQYDKNLDSKIEDFYKQRYAR